MIWPVINEKGGVGKTTTVANLGHALARSGYRVLLVDLDPQANLTSWIGVAESHPEGTIANALADKAAMPFAIGPSTAGTAELAYGSRAVADAADDLRASNPAPALALRRALRGLAYDHILIDCPPGLGVLSVNALCAADRVLVPVNSQAMALSGVTQLHQTLSELADAEVIQAIPNAMLLLTMFDERRRMARDIRSYLGDQSALVFESTIRSSAKIAECYGNHQTIFDYAPNEGIAADYDALALEMKK